MKKYLSILFTLALALCAAPTYADEDAVNAGQVTATWTPPAAPTGAALTGSELSDGSEYYLYNVGSKKYFVNGDNWGTEASLGSTGLMVKVSKATDTVNQDGNDEWTLQITSEFNDTWSSTVHLNTYVYYDYNTSLEAAHYWVDLASDKVSETDVSYINFVISETASGSNVYYIKGLVDDATNHVETGYLGWDGKDEDTEIDISVDITDNPTYAQWLLISQEEMDKIAQSRKFLSNAMTDAQELGIDIASAIVVYQNPESSIADLDAATATLAEAIQAAGTATGEIFDYPTTSTDESGAETTDTKTYRKVGANLIANPDFRYGIACWTHETKVDADGNDCSSINLTDRILKAIDWDNFAVSEDDDYGHILTALTGGGTGADGCLVTAWTIDPSKTYYFSCYTKNVAKYTSNGSDTDNSGNTTLDINTYTNSQGDYKSEPLTLANDNGEWTQQTLVFNVGEGTYSNGSTTTISYDDAENLYALIRCAWLSGGNASFASFELCEVEELTEEATELSDIIVNPKFDKYTDTDTDGNPVYDAQGWTTTTDENGNAQFSIGPDAYYPNSKTDDTSYSIENDQTYQSAESKLTYPFFEAYGGTTYTPISDRSFYQTIKLDAGEYSLTVDAIATNQKEQLDNVSGVYLYAGDEQTSVYTADGVPATFTVDFAVAEDETEVEIGVKLVSTDANWVAFDNFKLYSLSDDEVTHNLLALRQLIADATELVADNGTGADDLQAAIDAAQAVLDDVNSDAETLAEAMSTLKDAMELYNLENSNSKDILGVWVPQQAGTGFDFGTYTGTTPNLFNYYNGATCDEGTVLTQTLTDLPVGVYEVEIYCAANLANSVTQTNTDVTANDSKVVTIAANGVETSTTFGTKSASDISDINDVEEIKLENVVVGDEGTIELSIAVTAAGCVNWILVGTKSVTYTSSEVPTYADLQDALETATALLANVGDDVFQIPTEDAADLQAAIAAAEELTEDATISEINAALIPLTAATTYFDDNFYNFELNAPGNTQTFHIIMMSEDSKVTVTGNALTYIPDESNTQGGIDFQFISEPNANLADQVFNFTAVSYENGANAYRIEFFDADRTQHYLCTGAKYTVTKDDGTTESGNADGIRATTTVNDALTLLVRPDKEKAGVWHLRNTERSNNLGLTSDGVSIYTTNDYSDLALVNADEIEWTLDEAGYGTLVLPFAPTTAEIDGLTFYSTEAYGTEPELALTEVTSPAAGVPYIVKGEPGTYTFAVTERVFTSTSEASGWLTGAYASTEVPTDSYVLQDGEEGLAFYVVTADDPITLTPNHCYLTVSSTSDDETTDDTTGDTGEVTNAPAVIFFPNGNGNSATAITGVEANVADAEAVYDLSGRKVSQAQKGIYIKGGKKVVIK